MDNLPNATSALIEYIDSLLMDEDALATAQSPAPGTASAGVKADVEEALDASLLRVLFFKVAAIPLAVSLEDISGVVDVEEDALNHGASGDEGVPERFRYRDRDIETLDARDLILPSGHPARSQTRDAGGGHIIVLADYDVGLLCDQVGDIVDLQPEEVEWRMERRSRAWLAGMVRGHEHALLDIERLLQGSISSNHITN